MLWLTTTATARLRTHDRIARRPTKATTPMVSMPRAQAIEVTTIGAMTLRFCTVTISMATKNIAGTMVQSSVASTRSVRFMFHSPFPRPIPG